MPTLQERTKIWYENTGREIKVVIGDPTDPEVIRSLFDGRVKYQWAINPIFSGIPETVVHYAEQPSAPYSLINYKYANTTLANNLLITNNLVCALRDFSRDTPVIHIVKGG
ncbi:MAG: hypothetical protein U5L00_21335 [Desulfovermiculus sp.]|nr:hypothetical protein [Desulfovermiculus sp.]